MTDFKLQMIFLLHVSGWGEEQTFTMCPNPLELSVHLEIAFKETCCFQVLAASGPLACK